MFTTTHEPISTCVAALHFHSTNIADDNCFTLSQWEGVWLEVTNGHPQRAEGSSYKVGRG